MAKGGSEGKSKGLFENWLNMFVTNVFLQSFQAVFLMFLLLFISKLQDSKTASDEMISILTICGIAGLIKFEKLIKELFGIKEGHVGSMAGNFLQTMQGLKSGTDLAKRTAEPFKQHADIKRRRIGLDNAIKAKEISGKSNVGTSTRSPIVNPSGIALTNESGQSIDRNGNVILGATGNPINKNSDQGGKVGISEENLKRLEFSLNRLTNTLESSSNNRQGTNSGKSMEELKAERDDLALKERKASIQRFTRLGTTIGAVGGALGATEGGLGNAITAANAIDTPMDALSDNIVNKSVYKPKYTAALNNFNNAVKNGSADVEQAYKQLEKASNDLGTSMMQEINDFAQSSVKVQVSAIKNPKKFANKALGKVDHI